MNNKNITTTQYRRLIDNPCSGFKGNRSDYKKLIKSLLIPPDVKVDWRKDKNGEWERTSL